MPPGWRSSWLVLRPPQSTSWSPGKFDTKFAFAGACADDVIVCAEGTTTGKLKGAFTLNVTEIKPGAPGTDVLLFIGDASVETKDGTLRCSNSGALQTTGDGVLMSLCVALPGTGTGKWANASGYFQVNGHGSLGTGTRRATTEAT